MKTSALYIISGDDHFRKLERLNELVSELSAPIDTSLDYNKLDGRSIERGVLSMQVMTPPFFSEYKLLVIDSAENMSSDVSSELKELIKKGAFENPHLKIIVFYNSEKKGDSLAKLSNNVFAIKSLNWKNVADWVVEHTHKKYGFHLKIAQAKQIVSLVGSNDSSILASEIEKIFLLTNGNKLTTATLNKIIQNYSKKSIFDFCDNVGMKSRGEADSILASLIEDGLSEVRIISQLTSHMVSIGVVKSLFVAKNEAEIKKRYGWLHKKMVSQSHRWNFEEIDNALLRMAEIDASLKTGKFPQSLFRASLLSVGESNSGSPN